jgi:hypothetical protein
MAVVLIILSSLIAYPIIFGLYGFLQMDFIVEIKNLSSPYYTIGMHFLEYETDDEDIIEQEFCISLYLIVFKFVFSKYKEDA